MATLPAAKQRKLRTAATTPYRLGNANAALISCPACSRKYSRSAAACPGCGHPNPDARARAIASNDQRSRGIYVCLGVFLGFLGIHNFYAGRIGIDLFELFGFPAISAFYLRDFGLQMAAAVGERYPLLALAAFWAWVWLPPLFVIFELICVTKDGRGVPFR